MPHYLGMNYRRFNCRMKQLASHQHRLCRWHFHRSLPLHIFLKKPFFTAFSHAKAQYSSRQTKCWRKTFQSSRPMCGHFGLGLTSRYCRHKLTWMWWRCGVGYTKCALFHAVLTSSLNPSISNWTTNQWCRASSGGFFLLGRIHSHLACHIKMAF